MDSSMKDIVNGMRDIVMGNLVRLVCSKERDWQQEQKELLAVAGYAVRCTPKGITLSYQDPASPHFTHMNRHASLFDCGDRFFFWKGFSHYELLPLGESTLGEEERREPTEKLAKTNLIGRIKAGVGSIVQLRAEGLNVTGYVADFILDQIMLTHHDPLAQTPWDAFYSKGCTPYFPVLSGKRWYYLSMFNDYRILRSSSETPQ